MAVNIVSSPASQIPLSTPLKWVLENTDVGTPPIRNKIVYNLYNVTDSEYVFKDSSGNAVHQVIDTYGKDVPLIFNKDVAAYIFTTFYVPAAGINNEPNIRKQFRLDYDIAQYDSSDCSSTIPSPLGNSSGAVYVVSSFNEWYKSLDFTDAGLFLSARPSSYCNAFDTQDAVWVIGTGTVDYTWHMDDGTSNSTNASPSFGIGNVIPLSPDTLSLPSNTIKLITEISLDTGNFTKTYTVNIVGRPCNQLYADLYWLEPLGSYACQQFLIEGMTGVNEFTRACMGERLQTGFTTSLDENYSLHYGNRRMRNTKTTQSINFKRKFPTKAEQTWFLSTFTSARDFFMIVKDSDGNQVKARFFPNLSDIKQYVKDGLFEVELTGEVILNL